MKTHYFEELEFKYDVFTDIEPTTKQGVDKLTLMLFFMPLFDAKSDKQARNRLTRLKSFIVQQLKRGITAQEEIALLEGIGDYIHSDSGTDQRLNAMEYLFGLNFLNN